MTDTSMSVWASQLLLGGLALLLVLYWVRRLSEAVTAATGSTDDVVQPPVLRVLDGSDLNEDLDTTTERGIYDWEAEGDFDRRHLTLVPTAD
ncbi:hypothetical protein FB459_1864 [Yimella lutea]|uniref:Uncharacterized protein n=1 Tax=Yimella lutea TaxID=587872 RepID=A0A542EGG7_9MICO|nr:hypothetical protein [Yimella lutea]TQJ14405.1 hypothetical protein FB459_1864 [Yimella lutea]